MVELASTGRVVATSRGRDFQVCEVRLDDGVLVLGAAGHEPVLRVGARVRLVPDTAVVRFALDD